MSVSFSEGSAARVNQDQDEFQQANDNAGALRLVVERQRWSALESLPSPVVVLDASGTIRAANTSWLNHTVAMGARVIEGGVGTNYVATGRQSMNFSRETATAVTEGLRAVLAGERSVFDHEHACHPPEAEQWFHLTITVCMTEGRRGALVQHHDITERRQAERRRQFSTVVARCVEREAPRREVVRDVIAATCDLLGWEMAAVWSYDRGSRVLRCDNVHPHRSSNARGWSATTNQHGLAAKAWNTGAAILWSDGVEREDAQVARTALGTNAAHIVEACAMPVGADGRAEGVVVFYSTHRHRPDATFLRTLGCLLLGATWTRPELPAAEQRVSGPPAEVMQDAAEVGAPSVEKPKAPSLDTLIGLASMSAATVLLRGGSGVGKTRIAREIHLRSERARGPFVDLNCAMLTPAALEDDLFGHEVGAFPGADRPHRGVLEEATGGTILLDEVGCLDAAMQLKLSKLLETRSYRHLGGSRDLRADVRFIATSSRDLRAAVRAGTFREDLFYRLNVIEIAIPPLRARQAELVEVARRMLDEIARAYSRPAPRLAPDAERAIQGHTWPGNLREMRTVLERAWLGVGSEISGAAVVTSIASLHESAANDVETVQPIHVPTMPKAPVAPAPAQASAAPAVAVPANVIVPPVDPTSSLLAAQERAHIERVLAQTGYNMRRAALMLGISRSTLYLRAKDYHLDIGSARRIGRSGRKAANTTNTPKPEARAKSDTPAE